MFPKIQFSMTRVNNQKKTFEETMSNVRVSTVTVDDARTPGAPFTNMDLL